MNFVQPKVIRIGYSGIDRVGVKDFLEAIDAPEFKTDNPSAGELLIELAGRICYDSFRVGPNANITKVREGNKVYIENLVDSMHGSVLEHATVTYAFIDVSRVFMMELIRHRVGTAISAESGRYVRRKNLQLWPGESISVLYPKDAGRAKEIISYYGSVLEDAQRELAALFKLDSEKDFHKKKIATSWIRRILPEGIATRLIWTANLRTLRDVIVRRTDPAAEEEIRVVFNMVAENVVKLHPHVFSDFRKHEHESGIPYWTGGNRCS